jgi:hypothetical protein
MSFWDKFKQVAGPAAQVAQVVAPNTPAGDIARIVERVIGNDDDPKNIGALRALASKCAWIIWST